MDLTTSISGDISRGTDRRALLIINLAIGCLYALYRRKALWICVGVVVLCFVLCPDAWGSQAQLNAGVEDSTPLVPQSIRYHAPGAEEVWLVWGINGWKPVPDHLRPRGTIVKKNVLQTPLSKEGHSFLVTLEVPQGTVIDSGFLTTKSNQGNAVNIWEDARSIKVNRAAVIEIETALGSVSAEQRQAWLSGQTTPLPLVTTEVHYRAAEAGEVWFAWGVNGWQHIPQQFRPHGTTIRDNLMYSPMAHKGENFSTKVLLPPGLSMDYGFVITKTKEGIPVNVWEDAAQPTTSRTRIQGHIAVVPTSGSVKKHQSQRSLLDTKEGVPPVTQELRYRPTAVAEVWLEWESDAAGAKIPMIRENDSFVATVQIPSGAGLNYRFVITKQEESSSGVTNRDEKSGLLLVRLDGRIDVRSQVTKSIMAQRRSWTAASLDDKSLLTKEIRYRIAQAEEVWLLWGINGWQVVPEAVRPAGTVIQDKIMRTRMSRKGDAFSTTVRVPAGTTLDYVFLITRASNGMPVNIRQDSNGQDFWRVVRANGSIEERATVSVVTPEQRRAWLGGQTLDLPLIATEIRYHAPGATEVWLAWGLDSWQQIPNAARPAGTILKNNVMHTRMDRAGDVFSTSVLSPPGATIQYGFLIYQTEEDSGITLFQDKDISGRPFERVLGFDGLIEVQSTAWLSAAAGALPLASQEIRYRIAGAEEVWLVWGINNWLTIPKSARPRGTILDDNKVMQSPMHRENDVFSTTVKVPAGAIINYEFLITKTSQGMPVAIREDNEGRKFSKPIRKSGQPIRELATVSVVTAEQRRAWLASQPSDIPLVNQQINYLAPGASEVWLIWGVEGWQPAPESVHPKGTILRNGRLHTPMVLKGKSFNIVVRVPPGTLLNFSFLIAKTDRGKAADIQQSEDEERRSLSRVVAVDGDISVQSPPLHHS